MSASLHETESRRRLVALMTGHQRQIFAYIYTLVPDRGDAEDLLQETSVVICDKFDEFAPGTDFVAWACQIAWWRIRYARQKFARSKVVFDDEVLEVPDVARAGALLQTRRYPAGSKPPTEMKVGVNGKRQINLLRSRRHAVEIMEPVTHDGMPRPPATALPPVEGRANTALARRAESRNDMRA